MGIATASAPPLVEWEQRLRLQAQWADYEQPLIQIFYSVPNPENEVSPNADVEKKDFLP